MGSQGVGHDLVTEHTYYYPNTLLSARREMMLKLKLQYFGHLMQRANSLEKKPDAGKDGGQEKKRVAEDEMVRWYHQLNRHEFKQTPEDSEGY